MLAQWRARRVLAGRDWPDDVRHEECEGCGRPVLVTAESLARGAVLGFGVGGGWAFACPRCAAGASLRLEGGARAIPSPARPRSRHSPVSGRRVSFHERSLLK